jgi:hypothetical protein
MDHRYRQLPIIDHDFGPPRAPAPVFPAKSPAGWLRGEGIIRDDDLEKMIAIKRPKNPETLPDLPSHRTEEIFRPPSLNAIVCS